IRARRGRSPLPHRGPRPPAQARRSPKRVVGCHVKPFNGYARSRIVSIAAGLPGRKGRLSMKRRYVFAGLSLVIALALVSPALGGPSVKQLIKKLVKKEVTKQLAGKVGPAGAPGAPGAPGSPGADGTAKAFGYMDKYFCT